MGPICVIVTIHQTTRISLLFKDVVIIFILSALNRSSPISLSSFFSCNLTRTHVPTRALTHIHTRTHHARIRRDLAAPAVSAVASGLRVHRVFAAAMAFPAPAAPRDPSDPRARPASPASPDPKATKDSTGLKVAGAFKDRAERTVCPVRRENRASKARPVSTAPTERRDREATWDPKGRPDSQDPEDHREPPETREWVVPRVSR